MVANASGTASEKCAADRKVEAAYLHAHNDERYSEAKTIADVSCLSADVERTDHGN